MSAVTPDVVVIGGGHNGLVAAAYLARQTTTPGHRADVGPAQTTDTEALGVYP